MPTRVAPPTTALAIGDLELADIAWSYEQPLADAAEVGGLVCFYQERLTLIVDGRLVPRIHTPWS